MTTPPKDPNIRRSATRAPVGRPIKLQFDDSMDVIEGICRNVSIGGMFISFEDSRPAGSLVRFELELDESSAIRGLGEVVWMKSKNEFGGPESGFGLKFRFLEQSDRQMIFKLVSQHIKERLSKRPGGNDDSGVMLEPKSHPAPDIAVPPAPAPPSPKAPDAVMPGAVASPSPVVPEALVPDAVAPDAVVPDVVVPDAAVPDAVASDVVAPEAVALDAVAPEDFTLDAVTPDTVASEDATLASVASAASELPLGASPDALPATADFELAPPARHGSESLPETPLPALDDMSAAEFHAADDRPIPAGPVGHDPIDLDPSVGQTPMYELGLESEPPSAGPAAFDAPSVPDEEQTAPTTTVGESLGFGGTAADNDALDTDLQPSDSTRGDVWDSVAKTRRQYSLLPVVAVILLAVAAAVFLFKDELVARFGSEPSTPPASAGPAQEANSGPPPDGAGVAAGASPDAASPAGVSPVAADPATATPATANAAADAGEIDSQSSPPRHSAPPPSPPPPPTAVAAMTTATSPPSASAATGAEFTRLVDIAWSETAGGLKVILTADGSIPTGRYRYFRLDGESPREVVKLIGVDRGYSKTQLTIGGPGVQQIRVGFHRAKRGNEIHVVMDLADPRWIVSEVSNVGSRLELLLTPP